MSQESQHYSDGRPGFYGWIPPVSRTREQTRAHEDIMNATPRFALRGDNVREDIKKSVLWDFSKKVNNNKHFMVFHQITGSCVGNGGGQAVWYLSAVETARLHQPELALCPFYLLPYGRSRYYSGSRGRGEGSSGSGFAKAIAEDGILAYNEAGLPQPEGGLDNPKGITWGGDQEYQWSDGSAIDQKWLALSKKHLVRTVAHISSLDQARTALQNYYPLTIASNWGGLMQCPTEGTPPVLLSRHATQWSHQMHVNGWWEHPSLGELYYILNNWGPGAHGTPPDDAPPGGFWVKAPELQRIIGEDETFAFSQFDGFPTQELSWLFD